MNISELSEKINISESIILDLVRKGLPINEDKTFNYDLVFKWMSSESPNLSKTYSNKESYGEKILNELNVTKEYILEQNENFIKNNLSKESYEKFIKFVEELDFNLDNRVILNNFGLFYKNLLKEEKNNSVKYDEELYKKVNSNKDKVQIYWGSCLDYLKSMPSESIQLMCTSPPYYNARAYSQWDNLNLYLTLGSSIP